MKTVFIKIKNKKINLLKIKIMKFQSNNTKNLLESLTSNEIKNLTIEVRETIAHGFKKEKRKIFSAADLWNIQRQRKSILSRRLYF